MDDVKLESIIIYSLEPLLLRVLEVDSMVIIKKVPIETNLSMMLSNRLPPN